MGNGTSSNRDQSKMDLGNVEELNAYRVAACVGDQMDPDQQAMIVIYGYGEPLKTFNDASTLGIMLNSSDELFNVTVQKFDEERGGWVPPDQPERDASDLIPEGWGSVETSVEDAEGDEELNGIRYGILTASSNYGSVELLFEIKDGAVRHVAERGDTNLALAYLIPETGCLTGDFLRKDWCDRDFDPDHEPDGCSLCTTRVNTRLEAKESTEHLMSDWWWFHREDMPEQVISRRKRRYDRMIAEAAENVDSGKYLPVPTMKPVPTIY